MKNDYRNEFPLSPLLKEQKSQMDEKEYYREKIAEMAKKIDNVDWLKTIHTLLKKLLE